MSYHLCDHIYIAQFRDELILLDLQQDTYTICFQQLSDLLITLLDGNKSSSETHPLIEKNFITKSAHFSSNCESNSGELTSIQQLIEDHIIEE